MTANVETMMYAREVPWHGFGRKVDGLQTAEEALVAAELDWEVNQRPLYYRDPTTQKGDLKKVEERVANVRMSDGKYLGVVSPSYKIVQNATAFKIADAIVEDGGAKYETAGSLREGRVVFLSMEIPREIKVPGDDGDIRPYLLIRNGHDGRYALGGAVTPIRGVCENTVNAAFGAAVSSFSLRHTSGIEDRIEEARRALGLTHAYLDQFEEIAEKMLLTKLTRKQVLNTIAQTFPIKDVNPLQLTERELALAIADSGTTSPTLKALAMVDTSENIDNIRGTAWGVFNGIAEYLDYGTFYRSRGVSALDNRASSILLDGPAAQKKSKAAEILVALSNN